MSHYAMTEQKQFQMHGIILPPVSANVSLKKEKETIWFHLSI